MKTPTLETERLILRPISLDDAPAVQKLFNNWEVVQYLTAKTPWPYPDGEALKFLRDTVIPQVQAGKWHVWALVFKNGNQKAIGMMNLRLDIEKNKGNRGFWLAHEFHSRGLMTEAVIAANNFAFNTLGIEKLIVHNAKSNIASRRVKEKTGAVFLRED